MLQKLYKRYKREALLMLSGSTLLQVTGCTDFNLAVTAIATSVTAGGVIYLIRKVMD